MVKRRAIIAGTQLLLSFFVVVAAIFAWFAYTDPIVNGGQMQIINEYGVNPRFHTTISTDGENYDELDLETIIVYPDNYIYFRIEIENVNEVDIKTAIRFDEIEVIYNHEYYELNPGQTEEYTGDPLFDQTYWDTNQYYYFNSNRKIPFYGNDGESEKIDKEYFSNFIAPLTQAMEFYHGDENEYASGNLTYEPLEGQTGEFIFEDYEIAVGGTAVLYIVYHFNTSIYSSYFDPALGSSGQEVELKNSNPFMFQSLRIKLFFSFEEAA